MIETISPAVCGSRPRTALALVTFGIAAVLTGAALGALLGGLGAALGAVLGGATLLLAAAALALAGALREATGARVPIPQSRRQVPERWHHALPLPAWAAGYGAGLGAGVLTYQPVATIPATLAAALAVGEPALGAAIVGAHGAGRLVAAAAPAGAVDHLAGLARPMRRANALALGLAAAALLALAAETAGAAPATILRAPTAPADGVSRIDPAVGPDGTVARTLRTADGAMSVVIEGKDGTRVVLDGAVQVALDGDLAAVGYPGRVEIVRWRTREAVSRLDGWAKPALRWPWLVGQVHRGERIALVAIQLEGGRLRRLGQVGDDDDLGRPSITRDWTVLWHQAGIERSRILVANLASGGRGVFRQTRTTLLANPSRLRGLTVWVEQRIGVSRLYALRRGARAPRGLLTVRPPELLWTTATDGRNVWVTRWNAETGAAQIARLRAR